MKKILIILVVLLFSNITWADEAIDLTIDYTAEMVYESALELENKYPNLIKVIVLGTTNGNHPIFVVQLTNNVGELESNPETYTSKKHNLIEGGIHSRENPAAPVLLKTIETYVLDFYDESKVGSIAMGDILDEFVFHFIPLSNPDGYNLANFGINTVPEPYKSRLLSFQSKVYSQYKSNLNGVDLNRNFPGLYYDIGQKRWVDIWNKEHNYYRSYIPGSGYYFGYSSASEIETQLLMPYLVKYDFRNYLSYHSRGEVIYYHKWMLSDQHNAHSKVLSKLIAQYTGYDVVYTNQKDSSSGYLTDYTAMQTLKPSITVETVHYRNTLPVSNYLINAIYEEVLMVPIIAAIEGRRVGYFTYRLYKDGLYVRDFEELEYAAAIAEKAEGIIVEGVGRPEYYLSDDARPLNRREMIVMIMEHLDYEPSERLLGFYDTNDPLILEARALGLISGYNNYFRPYDYVSFAEVYVVLRNTFFKDYVLTGEHKIDYEVSWAEDSVSVLLENEIIDYDTLHLGKITLGTFNDYLNNIIGGKYD